MEDKERLEYLNADPELRAKLYRIFFKNIAGSGADGEKKASTIELGRLDKELRSAMKQNKIDHEVTKDDMKSLLEFLKGI